MSQTSVRPDGERYGAIETMDGDTVIYDREEANAWLQSSAAVPVEP